MRNAFDNNSYENKRPMNSSADYWNMMEKRTDRERFGVTYMINIVILIVSIASLIVGLIALFKQIDLL